MNLITIMVSASLSIKRLLQYRLCLIKSKELGFENVFSHYIADEVNVSAEQVRKDFSLYDIKGKKKAGYDIDNTLKDLDIVFGKDKIRYVILMGMGYIGRAMIQNNESFLKNKLYITAAFDINPVKQKVFRNVPVHHPEKLTKIVEEYKVITAILAVPSISAQLVCNELVAAGVKGIMSFAPVVLKVPDDVAINNVNLCNELESTVYFSKLL